MKRRFLIGFRCCSPPDQVLIRRLVISVFQSLKNPPQPLREGSLITSAFHPSSTSPCPPSKGELAADHHLRSSVFTRPTPAPPIVPSTKDPIQEFTPPTPQGGPSDCISDNWLLKLFTQHPAPRTQYLAFIDQDQPPQRRISFSCPIRANI